MADATKARLEDKIASQRPVAGLGRRSHADRLFLSLPGTGLTDAKLDIPALAVVGECVPVGAAQGGVYRQCVVCRMWVE